MDHSHSTPAPEMLDLLVIGGGINGTGIANDAAGRGLKVLMCEQGDLAGATSSASSKLIHGGLRYLEYYEFRLVREALQEREVLLKKAPHIIWPLRFILPHQPHLRPAWMIRAGLFLYDHLGRREALPGSRGLRFGPDSALQPELKRGFEYSDCWVDDARLVVLNALQARDKGAEILPRTRCIHAEENGDYWTVTLEDCLTRHTVKRRSKVLVNATGPWTEAFINQQTTGHTSRHHTSLVKGSHIITRRINPDDRAYILQNRDKRIVFVLPWEDDYSLIGTTDVPYSGAPQQVAIEEDETRYLLEIVNQHFKTQLTPEDILHSFSGVRALCDGESEDPSAISRDYTLDLDHEGAPLLSVFGGKITTYRKLAEAAIERLHPWFPDMGPDWTAREPLPGGDMPSQDAFRSQLSEQYPFLDPAQIRRFSRSYGTLCLQFLQGCRSRDDLGEDFGGGLTRAEVDYLVSHEWARGIEDILWRRTKRLLRLSPEQKARLGEYLAGHPQLQPGCPAAKAQA